MREVPLSKGMIALVDDEDYPIVCVWKWHARKEGNIYYARSTGVYQIFGSWYLHRLILNPGGGEIVDHIDGNGLNNQKSNLRIVSESENRRNTTAPSRNTSGVRCVHYCKTKRKWVAKYRTKGKVTHVGNFDTKEEAKEALAAAYISEFGTNGRWYCAGTVC